jgi:peroxin-3
MHPSVSDAYPQLVIASREQPLPPFLLLLRSLFPAMFSRLHSFTRRHRNKFIVASAVAGGVALLGKYAESKVRQWQEEQTRSLLEATRKRHHFESTQRTGSLTLQALLPELRAAVDARLDTHKVAESIAKNPDDKVALWEQLRATAIARCLAHIHCGLYLTLLLRIQLNILGGNLYLETTGRAERRPPLTSRVQEKFLELCQAFIKEGLTEVCDRLLDHAKYCSQKFGLKQKVSIVELEDLFQSVIRTASKSEESAAKKYLLRPDRLDCLNLNEAENNLLSELLCETADLLEQPDFTSAFDGCLQECLSLVFDSIAEELAAHHRKSGKNGFVGPAEIRLPFAKVIPILNSATDTSCGGGVVVRALLTSEVVGSLSANVYEAFCVQPNKMCNGGNNAAANGGNSSSINGGSGFPKFIQRDNVS